MDDTANVKPARRMVAIFDFDNTLIEGDSLWPFLGYGCGWPAVVLAAIKGAALFGIKKLQKSTEPEMADPKSFIKLFMLKELLAGKLISNLDLATKHVCKWATWNTAMQEKWLEHQAQGCMMVVASGGLNLYLSELLKGLGDYTLICTEMESYDRMLSGYTHSGNCVRQVKADRVAAFLKEHGPFDDSWGYGNYPSDVPMLELLKHRIIV